MIAAQSYQLVRGLWFVHRNQFLLALVGTMVCIGVTRAAMTRTPDSPQWVALSGILLAVPCLFLLTAIFSYCDLRACVEGPESTFPRFFARLPISSSVYVATSILGLAGSVVLWWGTIDYFVLTESVRKVLPASFRHPWLLLGLPILVLISVLSLGYAMALTAFERSWVRVVISPFVCAVPFFVLALGIESGWSSSSQILVQAGICVVALAAYQFCFDQGRHGVEMRLTFPVRSWTPIARSFSILPFRSPESSQFWFEWSRHGVGLLVFTIPTVALLECLCIAWWYQSNAYASKLLVCISMFGIALFVPVGVGSAMGLGVLPLKSRFRNYIGMPAFYATRPISDFVFVKILVGMSALSVILGIATSLAITVVIGSFSGANGFALFALSRAINEFGFASTTAIASLLTGIAFVAGFKMFAMNLLLNLTSKMWLWWLNYWGRFAILFLAVFAILYWTENPQPIVVNSFWATSFLLMLVAVKWGVTAVLVRRVLNRKLCSFLQVRLVLQLWLFLVLALSGLALFALRDLSPPALTVFSSFIVFIPINRLLASVLVAHAIRHGQ